PARTCSKQLKSDRPTLPWPDRLLMARRRPKTSRPISWRNCPDAPGRRSAMSHTFYTHADIAKFSPAQAAAKADRRVMPSPATSMNLHGKWAAHNEITSCNGSLTTNDAAVHALFRRKTDESQGNDVRCSTMPEVNLPSASDLGGS